MNDRHKTSSEIMDGVRVERGTVRGTLDQQFIRQNLHVSERRLMFTRLGISISNELILIIIYKHTYSYMCFYYQCVGLNFYVLLIKLY